MAKVSKRQRCTAEITNRIIAFETIHYGDKPEFIYMTEDLHKVLTGRKSVKYQEEFCGVKIKIFHSSGLRFFLVQKVFEVEE